MPELDPNTLEMVTGYVTKVGGALLLLFAGWIIAGWLRSKTRGALEKGGMDAALSGFLSAIARWTVLLFVIMSSLSVFGVETTSFAAVAGARGGAAARMPRTEASPNRMR